MTRYPEGAYVEVIYSNIGEEFIASLLDKDGAELLAEKSKRLSSALELLSWSIAREYER